MRISVEILKTTVWS